MAGSFYFTPVEEFRSNQIFVIYRNNKYSPILDLSAPTDKSYNDAIDNTTVLYISMATPGL